MLADLGLGELPATSAVVPAATLAVPASLLEQSAQVIADRRGQPVDEAADVTTVLVNTPLQVDGETRLLTDEELCRLLFLVLIAGLHTTKGALA